ncbi:MAG: hypothetical protein WC045_00495 [Patescibacteria group bacterium]
MNTVTRKRMDINKGRLRRVTPTPEAPGQCLVQIWDHEEGELSPRNITITDILVTLFRFLRIARIPTVFVQRRHLVYYQAYFVLPAPIFLTANKGGVHIGPTETRQSNTTTAYLERIGGMTFYALKSAWSRIGFHLSQVEIALGSTSCGQLVITRIEQQVYDSSGNPLNTNIHSLFENELTWFAMLVQMLIPEKQAIVLLNSISKEHPVVNRDFPGVAILHKDAGSDISEVFRKYKSGVIVMPPDLWCKMDLAGRNISEDSGWPVVVCCAPDGYVAKNKKSQSAMCDYFSPNPPPEPEGHSGSAILLTQEANLVPSLKAMLMGNNPFMYARHRMHM